MFQVKNIIKFCLFLNIKLCYFLFDLYNYIFIYIIFINNFGSKKNIDKNFLYLRILGK